MKIVLPDGTLHRGVKCDWVSLVHTPEGGYNPDLKEDNEYWKDLQR